MSQEESLQKEGGECADKDARFEDQQFAELFSKSEEFRNMGVEMELVRNDLDKMVVGDTYEVEVVEINHEYILVHKDSCPGIIRRCDLYWNTVETPEEILFVGDVIKVRCIEILEGCAIFSRKDLVEKPYKMEEYQWSIEELLKSLGFSENSFVGRLFCYEKYAFVENLRSDDGRLLMDPTTGRNLKVVVFHPEFMLEEGYYRVSLGLVDQEKRMERNQLYQFYTKTIEKANNPFKEDVERAFRKQNSPASSASLANLLNEVGLKMYSSPERMFFELIQNADDSSGENGVSISIDCQGNYLMLTHNGCNFSHQDFVSLVSAARSTKTNKLKTGYKGIGFKSVFSNSEQVCVNSGGYQFKFDKHYGLFSDFEGFYFLVNDKVTEDEKCRYLRDFKEEYLSFDSRKDIPWQLLPIWLDDRPKELKGSIFDQNSKVSFAMEIMNGKMQDYLDAANSIFNNPCFMLFLRNARRIELRCENKTICREFEKGETVLKTTFGKDRIKKYLRREFDDVPVTNAEFEKLQLDLRIKERINSKGDNELYFSSEVGQEIQDIPDRVASSSQTTVSFAVGINNEGIEKVVGNSFFVYLPMNERRFPLPFYVNADFALSSDRERLLDNQWNCYLMAKVGELLVNWVAELCKDGHVDSLKLLPTCLFDNSTQEMKRLADSFNVSFSKALKETPFILNCDGGFSKLDEIVLDNTGLSGIIGCDLFCKLLGAGKSMPSEEIDSEVFSSQVFEQVERVNYDTIQDKLKNNTDLNEWYIHADERSKNIFDKWLIENDCEEIINSLPIFEFDDGWKSSDEIQGADNYVVISTKFSHLKDLIIKVGLHCSIPFDNKELYHIDETKLFERIYKKIAIHNDIVKKLHQCRNLCAGVGEDENYYNSCYGGLLSDLREGDFITKEHELILSQIKPDLYSAHNPKMSDDEIKGINDAKYRHYIFYELPNTITQFIAETELTPQEKLLLINTDFYGIGEARIKEIELFYSVDNCDFHNGGEPAPLQNLLPYRLDAPDFIKPCMICKEECFPELQEYLISPENEFEEVVMPRLSKIVGSSYECSLSDIIGQYNLEGSQLRDVIREFSSDNSLKQLLPFVEDSDKNTKEYFLNSINKLELLSASTYDRDSYECRVLQIALSVYEDPSDFSSKIFFDGQCITDFTISNDVICECDQGEEKKKPKMSLGRLLPTYQSHSKSLEDLKKIFRDNQIKGADKFYCAKPKPLNEIYVELNSLLGIIHQYREPWRQRSSNAIQYLFSVYYRRRKWPKLYGLQIVLQNEDEDFVRELLDWLYDNKIRIEDSYFTYHLKHYFIGKYFDSDYIFVSEQLLPVIENWANDDEKKQYLIDNGVKDIDCHAVQFRKLFFENKPIDFVKELGDDELASCIDFIARANGFSRPFLGENQKRTLLSVKDKNENLKVKWNYDKMMNEAQEWDAQEYQEWIESQKPQIFIYHGHLPSQLLYNDDLLMDYDDTECHYAYIREEKKLYLSDTRKIEFVLLEVAGEPESDINNDDCIKLLMGKDSISKKEAEEKENKIKSLIEENEKKDRIIEQYQAKYGEIATLPESPEADMGGRIGGDIRRNDQIDENERAKKIVIEKLKEEEFKVPEAHGNYSIVYGVTKDSVSYPLVVKSCKNNDSRININPEEWDELFKPNSMMWIHWGNREVSCVHFHDLLAYQDKLVLTIDTINLEDAQKTREIMRLVRRLKGTHLEASIQKKLQERVGSTGYAFFENNESNIGLESGNID